MITVRDDILEVFAGGKSISYRLSFYALVKDEEAHLKGNGHSDGEVNVRSSSHRVQKEAQELGVFVEDGSLELTRVLLRPRIV